MAEADEIGVRISREIQTLCRPEAEGFVALDCERRILRTALGGAAKIVEAMWNESREDKLASGTSCPKCGLGVLHARGRPSRQLMSLLGWIELRRAYYVCSSAECSYSVHPRDLALNLESDQYTMGVRELVGDLSADMSFSRVAQLLDGRSMVRVGSSQVHRLARRLGDDLERDRRERAVRPEERFAAGEVCYVSMDGTGTPMRRDALEGVAGRAEDGVAKTRETKVLTHYRACRASDGKSFKMVNQTVSAAIESAAMPDLSTELAPFTRRLRRQSELTGFDDATRQVAVADGAAWIWNQIAELYPGATQILDIYHAVQKLWDVAHEAFPDAPERGRKWVKVQKRSLLRGRLDRTLAVLKHLSAHYPSAKRCRAYYLKQRPRMDYRRYLREGLCISSAVVEGQCKHVVGGRLKGSGRHWSMEGANAIASLRCSSLNGWIEGHLARVDAANRCALNRIKDPSPLRLAA